MCPNKLGAAVKDAENKSRTVLARSLLSAFYHKDELLGKNFSEIDKDIIEACVGMLILQMMIVSLKVNLKPLKNKLDWTICNMTGSTSKRF